MIASFVIMRIVDLGLIDYQKAFEHQKKERDLVMAGEEDVLLFCQHPLTITCGRKTQMSNILLSSEQMHQKNCQIFHIDRGGDVTLHLPGQIVMYPIVHLKRRAWGVLEFLKKLEQSVIDFLRDFDILALGDDGQRGVWIQEKKIASIGIGISRWVSFHGVAVNINPDMKCFQYIRPCGLDVVMVSLKDILQDTISDDQLFEKAWNSFQVSARKVFIK